MNFPFIKKKQQTGLIIQQLRKPDPETEDQSEGESGIRTCASDLLKAVEAKSIDGIAEALKSAFEILDSQPHVEGDHLDEDDHSYNAQNIRAAKEDRG